MKKYCAAVIIITALLLGACGGRFADSMHDERVPKAPAVPDAVEADADDDSGKAIFVPGVKDSAGKSPDSVVSNVSQETAVNRIEFEVVSDGMPADLEAFIDMNKEKQGFAAREIDGEWYVAVFMGEQLTGGFAVEVDSIEGSGGRTNIFVNELKPDDDAILLMALTYPYQVVRINGNAAPRFKVVNQDGLEYPEIE